MSDAPANIVDTVNRMLRPSRQVLSEGGQEPTAQELADQLNVPVEAVHRLLHIVCAPIRPKP